MKKLKPGKDFIGVGGGVLIFNKKKEVFLAQRSKGAKNQAGWWSKPGGTIEYGEKAIDAMKREIREEHNIEINIWGYMPHTDQILKQEGQHWLAVNYLADLESGEPKIMEPHKCDAMGWFSFKKLPKKLTKTTSEPIKNYLAGKYIKL